jgi:hypothetical protein
MYSVLLSDCDLHDSIERGGISTPKLRLASQQMRIGTTAPIREVFRLFLEKVKVAAGLTCPMQQDFHPAGHRYQ